MNASRRGSLPPESVARSPLARRIADLLTDVLRGPIVRWRVTRNGKLLMVFPGHKARDEQEARRFAKARLGDLWRETDVVEAVR